MNYRLFVPPQATGANLVYFDLFNATGSGFGVEVLAVIPIVSGAAAVTGVLAADLYLTRTSAVGTGGTAATYGDPSLTAASINPMSGGPCNPFITARLTPTGGATAGPIITLRSFFTEETNAGTYRTIDMIRGGMLDVPSLKVSIGSGIRVVQGAVASVGNIGFDVAFRLIPQ